MVCVKQIPDPADPYQLDPDTHRLVRPAEQILDDTDRYGVELGLQIAESQTGSVTLLSMGPEGNMGGIRPGLAMGADAAVLVDDPVLAGADALLTAQVLAAAISRSGFDVVIAGTESTDGYAGVVPQMVAELLGVEALTYATKVEASERKVTVHRQTVSGFEVVEAELPALISVTAGAVEPRYPSFRGIMEAKKKPIQRLSLTELGISPEVTQQVTEVSPAPTRAAGEIIEDDGNAHMRIVELLEAQKVI